jgi:putative oligomerization/nucleic acid binding protein
MFRARRRPLMRAAMVGGTAYMAGKAGQRAAYREQQEHEQGTPEAQAPQAAAAQAAPSTDMVARLNQLTQLHASGALTDDEFAAAKQQLLAG